MTRICCYDAAETDHVQVSSFVSSEESHVMNAHNIVSLAQI